MITTARFRQLALAYDDASEVPHMERQAFRTPRRTYVTLAPDGRSANLGLNAELQDMFTRSRPHAFTVIPNGWGRMGWTTVDLDAVDEASLTDALAAAHTLAQPAVKPARKPVTSRPKPTQAPSKASTAKDKATAAKKKANAGPAKATKAKATTKKQATKATKKTASPRA